jgi:hypothetical protein
VDKPASRAKPVLLRQFFCFLISLIKILLKSVCSVLVFIVFIR